MSLRLKMELLLLGVVVGVVVLGYSFERWVVLPRFLPQEKVIAADTMGSALEVVNAELLRIESVCSELAARDETLRFVEGRSTEGPDFLPSPTSADLDFLYVFDENGRILGEVFSSRIDKSGLNALLAQEETRPATHRLTHYETINDRKTGIMSLGERLLLLSSQPIVSWEAESGIGGVVLGGRLFDEVIVGRIENRLAGSVLVWSDAENAPADAQAGFKSLLYADGANVLVAGPDRFAVYSLLRGFGGEPVLWIQATTPRRFAPMLTSALNQNLLVQLVIVLMGFALLMYALRSIIIAPLAKLHAHATSISHAEDLTTRLELQRDDEIGQVAQEFNRMVERLQGDMSARRHTEKALRESEERYALAVKGSNEGLWDWDLKTNRVYYSPRWKAQLGYEEKELDDTPNTWLSRIHPEDLARFKAAHKAHMVGSTGHFEVEYRLRHKDDTYIWVLTRGLAIADALGEKVRMAGSQSDITARKRAEEQLTHRALHDPLTDLPNRALLLDRLEQAIRYKERNPDSHFAVLFLDLDHFKMINDSMGHVVGDQLLMSFTKKLQKHLRGGDTISRATSTLARFDGDEFVVLLEETQSEEDAVVVAQRIQELLAEAFHLGEHEVYTTASIGIAVDSEHGVKPEEYLRNADTAMYQAKAQGRACHVVYDDTMREQVVGRMQIETDLRHALNRSELEVYYQPIVDLKSGAIGSFEALLRWRHPGRGFIPPAEFIPVAEEMGLIMEIGRWVLHQACSQTMRWRQELPEAGDLAVSINVSVRQFSDPLFIRAVEKALKETGLPPHALKLEITESVIMENVDLVTETLDKLRSLGLRLSLDDFGTGYSSLSYLHRFPMNILKIDQSFIRNLLDGRGNYQLVRTILMMAENFDMTAIAEGIENQRQIDELREMGCQQGQGYYFSPPVDAPDATVLLRDNLQVLEAETDHPEAVPTGSTRA